MFFDDEKRFISEEDARAYYMGESAKAYHRYSSAIDEKLAVMSVRTNTFLFAMPEHVTNSICENSTVGPNSRLRGHFKRDIVRNISEAVILDFLGNQIAETGRVSCQISYDEQGNPLGDAAYLTSAIVEEMQNFDNAYGQDGEVQVNTRKIEFAAMSKDSVVITNDKVTKMDCAATSSKAPIVQ